MMKHWLETQSGARLDLENPIDFALSDVIWGCARAARYNGQFRPDIHWYSVAEHSILVMRAVRDVYNVRDRRVLRTALCHDLSEGLLGDIPTPLKALLPAYQEIEERICQVLAERLDLIHPLPQVVKNADRRILLDEVRWIHRPRDRSDWNLPRDLMPLGIDMPDCWSPREAHREFKNELRDLGVKEWPCSSDS